MNVFISFKLENKQTVPEKEFRKLSSLSEKISLTLSDSEHTSPRELFVGSELRPDVNNKPSGKEREK